MKKLYLFNPDNDLALASGLDYYTPPPMAAQLSRDLQMLPAWWADDNAYLLTNDPVADRNWAQHLNRTFGINIELIDRNHIQNHEFSYQPWGWNISLRNHLLSCCVGDEQLPDKAKIAKYRELSHRRTTIAIHSKLAEILGYSACQPPKELFTITEVEQFADKHPRCFLKAPWSSSGKGIFRPTGTAADNRTFHQWANGILQRQGSIIAETALNKTQDFAMEFQCSNGKASFVGYSIYYNDPHNSFDYGLVATEETLHSILCAELGDNANSSLTKIKQALEAILSTDVAPHYDGFLGIDMLIFVDEIGKKHINPCVEMNLRCTMGVVTSIVGNRFMSAGSIGQYHVEYHKTPFDVAKYMTKKLDENPPIIELIDDFPKIKSGTILMAPVYGDSRYCVYIDAQSK
ncbi:MAG: hypothetical protein ACI4AH_07650 [Muribaculaceae bacterium]